VTDTLTVAGVELPLVQTSDGPRLAAGGELATLAELVNAHLDGDLPELRERLQEGAPITPSPPVPNAAVLEILDRLLDLRATATEHAADLEPPGASAVDEAERTLARALAQRAGAPGRAEELARLDRRAAELDAMSDPAEAAARRRALLIEMEVLGLLSAVDASGELGGLPALASYHAAARRLAGYLASDERRAMLPGAGSAQVPGAAISLDWFRAAPPPGRDRTALGEALLAAATLGPEPEGEFFTQWDGRWYRVRWRRDDGNTPALLGLEPA
jgi:hypothetical protein